MLLEQEKAQRRLPCLYLYAHGLEVCIICKNILSFWAEEWSENLIHNVEILHFAALRSEWQGSMKRLIFITKFTKYWWNDFIFEFYKEHHRCSMKFTGFSIYTFRKIFLFIQRFLALLRFVQNEKVMFSTFGL